MTVPDLKLSWSQEKTSFLIFRRPVFFPMSSFLIHELCIQKVWQMFCFSILMRLEREMDMEEDEIEDRLDEMMFICL